MDKWLRNTNVVKVVALAIGVLLWVVVHLDVKENTGATAPTVRNTTVSNVMVKPLYDETQYSIVSIEPNEVTVALKGKDSAIREISPKNFQIVVDLTQKTAGTFELEVKPEDPLPAGVTAEVSPTRVKVVMEEKQMKEVPVVIQLVGKPAEGYLAGQPIVNPARVYVTVPSSIKESIDSARAEVNIDQANAAVSKKVKLAVYDKNGRELVASISPPVVEVEVPITLPFKVMPLQIKWLGEPARGFAIAGIQQNAEQVTVYGPQSILDKMDFYEGLQVDLSALKEDKVFTLDIPVVNKSLQVEPGKVEIRVTVVPAAVRTLDNVPIAISGQMEGMQTKFLTPESGTLSLTVEGVPAAIEKLRAQDIQAALNVSGLPPGKHELSVNVGLPPFIKRIDAPVKVNVEITQITVKPESTGPSPSPLPTPAPSTTVPAASLTPAPSSTPSKAESGSESEPVDSGKLEEKQPIVE